MDFVYSLNGDTNRYLHFLLRALELRRWTPSIRNCFAIGGAASPGLRPLRGHLVTMDDLSRLTQPGGRIPCCHGAACAKRISCSAFPPYTRKLPFFLFCVSVFFFPDTQTSFFLVLRVRLLFHRYANFLFSCFACLPSFSPTRRFPFFLFCVPASFFPDTQISIFLFLRVRLLFHWHANFFFSHFACLLHANSCFFFFTCTDFQTLACRILLLTFYMHAFTN